MFESNVQEPDICSFANRELAVQCHSVIEKLSKFTDVRACLVMGGLSNEQQEAALRRLPDIVVATPGTLYLNHAILLTGAIVLVLLRSDDRSST